MATVAINLYSDLQQPVKVQYIDGNMFSMDNAGNTVNVYVNDGGEPATLSGDVSALVIRPDGATVAVPGALDGNRAYVIMPQAVYAVPGVVSVVVKLTINTTVTTIAAFVANVYQSSTDTVVDPGTIIPSVQNLISAINAAVASIPADYSALWATLAPAYTSKAYAVGDYCTNGGVLYRCIVPITAAESWTAAHWIAANIGNDLSALKSALNKQDANLQTLSDEVYVDTSCYELGSITISNTGWTYNDATTYIRTKQGYTVHLKPGDSFGSDGTSLNFRMLVGWRKTDGVTYDSYSSFIYDRYTAVDEGDYVFSIQFTDGSVYTVDGLMSHFYVKRISNREIDTDGNINRINAITEDGEDKIPAHFFRGAFTSATAFSTTSSTARKRIMSLDYIKYNRAVTIKAKTGYQFTLYLYSSPGTSTGSVSFTDETVLTAGQLFRISITKSTPETIDVFDFADYVDSVSVTTFISENVAFLKENIGTSNMLSLEVGYIRYGSSDPSMDGLWTVGNGKTIATPKIYKFIYPIRISMNLAKYTAYIYYYSTNDEDYFTSRSSQLTADYDIPANTYFRVLIGRIDNAVLTNLDIIDASDSLAVYGLTGTYTRETTHELQVNDANISRYDPIALLPHVAAEICRVDDEIKAKYGLGNIGVFGFNTDQHLRDNAIDQTKNSRVYCTRGLRAMSILTQRHPFDFVCLGGDAAGYYTTTIPGIVNDVVEVNAALHDAACPVLSLTGNHDAYENNHSMTNGDMYFAHVKKAEKIANITMDDAHTNYVLDSKGNKIRYIFLDDTPRDGYTLNDCADYLDASLQGTPEGYSIVILSHHAISSALDSTNFPNPLGLQSHLVDYKDKIICCVNGHSHRDGSETSADILYIETTSSGLDGIFDTYGRVLDSATETAQDVYIIDKNAKKIYTVRYGAGNNREFDYDSTSETFGEIL